MSAPRASLSVEALPTGVTVTPAPSALGRITRIGVTDRCQVLVTGLPTNPRPQVWTVAWSEVGWQLSSFDRDVQTRVNEVDVEAVTEIFDGDLIQLDRGLRLRFHTSVSRDDLNLYLGLRQRCPATLPLWEVVCLGSPEVATARLEGYLRVWRRLEEKVPLRHIIGWGSVEDAEVAADERLQQRIRAELEIIEGRADQMKVAMHHEPVVVGRGVGCDLRIVSATVSRRHIRFFWENDRLMVEDLNSTSGFFINQTRCANEALSDGDVVELGGDTQIRVRIFDR